MGATLTELKDGDPCIAEENKATMRRAVVALVSHIGRQP